MSFQPICALIGFMAASVAASSCELVALLYSIYCDISSIAPIDLLNHSTYFTYLT